MNSIPERFFSLLPGTIYFDSALDLKKLAKAGRKLESIHSLIFIE